MRGWRTWVGVTASVGLHVLVTVALDRPPPSLRTKKLYAAVELATVPNLEPKPEVPPPPEPTPPERPERSLPNPSKRSEPPTLQRSKTSTPTPREQPASEPHVEAPVVLAGLSMSNEGVLVPTGVGGVYSGPTRGQPDGAVAPVRRAPEPSPTLTPVSDLSKKPNPPALDGALARFYPASLRNQGIEGEALMDVVLSRDGKVVRTRAVSESHPGFAQACEKALGTSRWEPPIDRRGQPTMTSLKYRCRFRIH
jgi:outer membrane biosynthesis protein TonB